MYLASSPECSLDKKAVLFQVRGMLPGVCPSLPQSIVHRYSVSPASLSCLRSSSMMTCVLCLLWAGFTAEQYLVTGLVH